MAYTDEEKLQFLLGQLAALESFAQAVLLTHKDPEGLLAIFETQLLKTEANTMLSPVGESYLHGVRFVQARLYPAGKNPAEQ